MKYQKWIDNNCENLEGKVVVITGATGGIGSALLKQLDYLNATIILAIRNFDKAQNIIKKSNLKKDPIVMKLDLECFDKVDNFLDELRKININVDYFINNAGIYNMTTYQSKDNHEIHMQINTFSTLYLSLKIREIYPNSKIIFVNSVSSYISKIDNKTIENYISKKAIFQYGATKLLTMTYVLNKGNDKNVLVHPGIASTNMLLGGWNKGLQTLCNPICKMLFMNPEKAALSILYSLFNNIKSKNIVCPRGFLSCWGYPKVNQINKRVLKNDIQTISEYLDSKLPI